MQSKTARDIQKKFMQARSQGSAVSRSGNVIIQTQLFPEPVKQKGE